MDSLLASIVERGRALLDLDRGNQAEAGDLEPLAEALLSSRGEASGAALSAELLNAFQNLDDSSKLGFLKLLAERFGPDSGKLDSAIESYRLSPGDLTASQLHSAAEPRRQELIRRLNQSPGGAGALVEMRKFLLSQLPDNPELKPLDGDFHHLLSSWFNRGFLVMRRIDWNAPASVLEKIIRYEAVHAIGNWESLRGRIDPPDRLCYGFFHPALVDDPLIFVQVALTDEIPSAIEPVISPARTPLAAESADTAVFYSISNCQAGLRGVSFGSFLIKRVVEELHRDFPRLRTFATLSPAPGLRGWLKEKAGEPDSLSAKERSALAALDEPNWTLDGKKSAELGRILTPLAASYFVEAKRLGKPIDSVARFHLGNGARLERINWMGDLSEKGMRQSAGFMVNYVYALPEIEENHEAYAMRDEIAASPGVLKLLNSRRSRGKQ